MTGADSVWITSAAIARAGALVGDPGRASMLVALLDGRALTAKELADRAGVTPATASSHLGKLLDAEYVCVQRQGRHRYYRLASADIAAMLESIHLAGSKLGAETEGARRSGPREEEMRRARSCYDHLAGRLGVAIATRLEEARHIRLELSGVELTGQGEAVMRRLGIDLDQLRQGGRTFCRTCIDWSERRPHLAGALGAAILERSLALGWVRRREGTRALAISPGGTLGFEQVFGISVARDLT